MFIFMNDADESGVELTVEEFRAIVEHELIDALVFTIVGLSGNLYVSDAENLEQIQSEIISQLERYTPSEIVDGEPSMADLKVIEIMRSLGFQADE